MAFNTDNGKYYLLSSQARIQVPYIKVTIGDYTFGAFSRETRQASKDINGFYQEYEVQYPNYVKSLNINKINGKVNQYTLTLEYPVTQHDDPNFFEKVLSSVSVRGNDGTSKTARKIIFSYGDTSMPSYIFKNEEALITGCSQTFDLQNSVITYTIKATSTSILGTSGSYSFTHTGPIKPSDEIKRIFKDARYGLQDLFTGMSVDDLDYLIDGSDAEVTVSDKLNISALDYIGYLVNCMLPVGTTTNSNLSNSIYVLTMHDDTSYDRLYDNGSLINGKEITGPYFKVEKVTTAVSRSDAMILDVGYNTSTIVTGFNIENNENYSMYFDYQGKLNTEKYSVRLDNSGKYYEAYAPVVTSNNDRFVTRAEDISWYSKITKYPINATVVVQGLLKPTVLMSYIRLNVIFPGGHKHIASGLYMVTKQVDQIDANGYKTTLSMTKISGDELYS